MTLKRAALVLPLLTAAYVFAFAEPAVYPGAKPVGALNDAGGRPRGQNTMAYNTPDCHGKVYDFYKSKGTEEPRAHRASPREKFAMIMFKDTGYTVAISWKESAKSDGTVIHVAMGAGLAIRTTLSSPGIIVPGL